MGTNALNRIIDWRHTAEALQGYAAAVASEYKEELLGDDRIAKGDLIRSVQTEIVQKGNTLQVVLDVAAYWKYVEYGTKPHWPPPDKIREWIEAKPVLPRPLKSGKLPTVQQLTYLIGRKISRVGTKGSNTLRHTLEEINAEWADRIAAAMAEDVAGEFFAIFKEF